MPTELWLVHKCKHGKTGECHRIESPKPKCEGGSVEVLDPTRVLFHVDDTGDGWAITVQDVIDELCLVMGLMAEEECGHDWKYGTALTDEYSPAHCSKCGTMDRNTAGLR